MTRGQREERESGIVNIGDGKGKRRKQNRQRAVTVFLSGMLVLCGLCFSPGIFCKAKETRIPAVAEQKSGAAATKKQKSSASAVAKEKKDSVEEEQEVVDFVTAYREAVSPEGIETLADYVDDSEDETFQMDLLRMRATLDHGVIGWENIKVVVCPMSDGKHWLASVSGDLIVEGIDVGIPGLNVLLVGRNEKGELRIELSDNGDLSEEFYKEMRELMLTDEMVDHNNEIAMAYNKLIAERPDIVEWMMETNSAVDKETGEMLAREKSLSVKADSKEETSDAKNGSYIVKKGDCLWNIAEEQLGDGLRWSILYESNKAVIGEDPNLIYVGIELQLR